MTLLMLHQRKLKAYLVEWEDRIYSPYLLIVVFNNLGYNT